MREAVVVLVVALAIVSVEPRIELSDAPRISEDWLDNYDTGRTCAPGEKRYFGDEGQAERCTPAAIRERILASNGTYVEASDVAADDHDCDREHFQRASEVVHRHARNSSKLHCLADLFAYWGGDSAAPRRLRTFLDAGRFTGAMTSNCYSELWAMGLREPCVATIQRRAMR